MKTKVHKFGIPTYIIKTYYNDVETKEKKVSYLEFVTLDVAKKIYIDYVKEFGIENVTFLSTKQMMLIDENGDFVGMERPF